MYSNSNKNKSLNNTCNINLINNNLSIFNDSAYISNSSNSFNSLNIDKDINSLWCDNDTIMNNNENYTINNHDLSNSFCKLLVNLEYYRNYIKVNFHLDQ